MLIFSATKTKPRTMAGRGKKSLLSGPGSGLRLGREKEKESVRSPYLLHATRKKKQLLQHYSINTLSFDIKLFGKMKNK